MNPLQALLDRLDKDIDTAQGGTWVHGGEFLPGLRLARARVLQAMKGVAAAKARSLRVVPPLDATTEA